MGWDERVHGLDLVEVIFQSTHPVWDGTKIIQGTYGYIDISIHPSRVGWDRLTRIWQQ